MRPRAVLPALAAGLAAFLVVGVAVTELTASRVEFSLLLGIPAGLLAGVAATAVVLLGLGGEEPVRRRVALALGGFGATLLLVLLAGVLALSLPVTVSLVGGVAVGAVVAVAAFAWLTTRTADDRDDAPGFG